MSRHWYLLSKEVCQRLLAESGFSQVKFVDPQIAKYNPGDVDRPGRFIHVVARK